MSVWFTSDLHIGHGAVAELRATAATICAPWGTDELRPFVTKWHDRTLADGWDSVVKPDDQVWILGDISAGGKAAQANALAWLAQRPGEKHLIAGNHDGCHPMHRDAHKVQQWYLANDIQSVQAFARRRIAGQSVLLSHFPYQGDHQDEDRCTQYRLRDEGEWLLHGHTHSVFATARTSFPRQINVGVDAWNLRPVQLDVLAELIQDEP